MEKKILFLAVMEAIPTIVCDTLYTLGLHDQIPSWKIMDNKGRITVVLHWEPEDVAALRSSNLPAIAGPSRQSSTCSTIASGGPRLLGIHARLSSQVRFLMNSTAEIWLCDLLSFYYDRQKYLTACCPSSMPLPIKPECVKLRSRQFQFADHYKRGKNYKTGKLITANLSQLTDKLVLRSNNSMWR